MGEVVVMNPPAGEEAPALPQNIEAEAALLGAMMIENKLIDPIADILKPEHFFEPLHARIFSAILSQASNGRLANPVTLKPFFDADEAMKEVGGPAYLAQLTGSGAAVIGARSFAEQVKELAMLRLIIGGLSDVVAQARDTSDEVEVAAIVSSAEQILALASEDIDEQGEEISAGDAAARVVDNLHANRDAGVRSGIEALDAVLGPIQPKSLTILGARPGMGKTATAISYALGAAKKGHGVGFLSLEMSSDDLSERALSDMCFDDEQTRLPFNAITSGNVSQKQSLDLGRAAMALKDLPLQIIDRGSATISQIERLVKRYRRRFEARGQKLELFIVDYLQLVSTDHREKDLYTRITEVSKGLKRIAKKTGVPIMALCQLSRDLERRADKRPMLSDLRDSGQIEQDADAVLFLLRPEYYLAQARPEVEDQLAIWEDAMHRVAGLIEFICAKRRRGQSATGRGAFYGPYQAVR